MMKTSWYTVCPLLNRPKLLLLLLFASNGGSRGLAGWLHDCRSDGFFLLLEQKKTIAK